MAYCQVSDVQGLAPQIEINATSRPNTAQVQDFINNVERDLNTVLTNLGYVTPVTGTEAVKTLKDKVRHKVLGLVLRSRGYGATDSTDQGAAAAEKVYDEWLAALKKFTDPTELPSDATRTGEAIEKDGVDYVNSYVQTIAETDRVIDNPPTMGQVF